MTLQVTPDHGGIGTVFTVSGKGCRPGDQVDINFGNTGSGYQVLVPAPECQADRRYLMSYNLDENGRLTTTDVSGTTHNLTLSPDSAYRVQARDRGDLVSPWITYRVGPAGSSAATGRSTVAGPGSSPPLDSGSGPCTGTPAAPWSGWQAKGGVLVTAGADPGSVCIAAGAPPWGGLYLPHAPGSDYTISVQGRLAHAWGWGVAAGAAWSPADGTVSGYAIQYDMYAGGYDDPVYPGIQKTVYPAATDYGWHTLTVIVRGPDCTVEVDEKTIARGQLSGTGNGIFIRVWNQSKVELRTPVITTG
jgi:hypothetical protein